MRGNSIPWSQQVTSGKWEPIKSITKTSCHGCATFMSMRAAQGVLVILIQN